MSKIAIGVLWCTFFQRRGLWTRPHELRDAYRPPTLFAATMRDAGYDVELLSCDDLVQVSDFDGSRRRLQDGVEVLYLMTHGVFSATGYDVLLHSTNWQPGLAGLGNARLAVVVFDTCKLIDTSQVPAWRTIWDVARLGPNLRLMLGFDGPAVIDRPSALRGKAFAEELISGAPFANAWFSAVGKTCGHSQYRKAVAIGIGDTSADAQTVLDNASLSQMPAPRGAGAPSFEERY